MHIFKDNPASEMPSRAEIALRILAIKAQARREGLEFKITDGELKESFYLADRFIGGLNHVEDPEGCEDAEFFARHYIYDDISKNLNPPTENYGQVQ